MNYKQFHASGHASKKGIFSMIQEISPKKVMPVHTLYPKLFKKAWKKVVIAEDGKNIEV